MSLAIYMAEVITKLHLRSLHAPFHIALTATLWCRRWSHAWGVIGRPKGSTRCFPTEPVPQRRRLRTSIGLKQTCSSSFAFSAADGTRQSYTSTWSRSRSFTCCDFAARSARQANMIARTVLSRTRGSRPPWARTRRYLAPVALAIVVWLGYCFAWATVAQTSTAELRT